MMTRTRQNFCTNFQSDQWSDTRFINLNRFQLKFWCAQFICFPFFPILQLFLQLLSCVTIQNSNLFYKDDIQNMNQSMIRHVLTICVLDIFSIPIPTVFHFVYADLKFRHKCKKCIKGACWKFCKHGLQHLTLGV